MELPGFDWGRGITPLNDLPDAIEFDEGLVDVEFRPVGVLALVTEGSIWFLCGHHYVRMPKDGLPRHQLQSIGGRLDDDRWHRYRQAWLFMEAGWLRARLLPWDGPVDGQGIYTGGILSIDSFDEVGHEHSDGTSLEGAGS